MKRNRKSVKNDDGRWPSFISFLRIPGIAFEDERRILLCVIFLLIGIPFLLGFAITHFFRGDIMEGLFLLLFGAGFLTVSILSRSQKVFLNIFRINLAILGCLFIYLLILAGMIGAPGRVLYMYIFPFFSYYLLGKREGLLWNGIIVVIFLPVLLIPDRLFGVPPHSADFISRFIVTFILASTIGYFYEAVREKYERGLEEEQDKLHSEIEERRLAEEAVKRERDRAQRYLDIADVIIVALNPDCTVSMINQKGAQLLGYPVKEVIGKDWFDWFFPERTRKQAEVFFGRLLAGGTNPLRYYENPIITKDGQERIIAWHNTIMRDETGQVTGTIHSGEDITDRKRAEEALRDSERKLALHLQHTILGVIEWDPDSRIMEWNPAAEKIFGYKKDEVIANHTASLIFSESITSTWNRLLAQRGGFYRTGNNITKDGKNIICEWFSTPIADDTGKTIGVMSLVQDITEKKRLEKERERWIEELQRMNKELKDSTERLEEATVQLIQSEKLSALGELMAGVAHELNQPLNGIKIISQSLLRDMERNRVEEGEVEEDLKEIVIQVNKMAEIIDHMRIYTRSTEGSPKEAIDIHRVLDGPFRLLNQQLKNHDVNVVRQYAPDLPKVLGDPIRLEQVFMNLITNARNALDSFRKENKRIEIRTYKTNNNLPGGDTSSVVVEVNDNGGGIPEDLREKIFRPFFTTKEPGKGTGLGLSVSSKIIEEHQGKIELESTTGEGTTFRVILPVTG